MIVVVCGQHRSGSTLTWQVANSVCAIVDTEGGLADACP
jgi:hypothetical protein